VFGWVGVPAVGARVCVSPAEAGEVVAWRASVLALRLV
jgi:hypothetical protein